MKYLLLIISIGLTGCTSFRMNEEFRINEEFGTRLAAPITALHVEFIEGQNSLVGLQVVTPRGAASNFQIARQKAEAEAEIPKLRTLLRNEINHQLIPMLSERLRIEESLIDGKQPARLRIQSTSGSVECGTGSLICQASIRLQLRLVAGDLEPIWVATYKVGAPLNNSNNSEVMHTLFSDFIERLESNSIIPKKYQKYQQIRPGR